MKVFTIILSVLLFFTTVGCVSVDVLFAAADAGLNGYEAGVPQGSDQYILVDKIDGELQNLDALYVDAEKASNSAKPGIESHIASVVIAITKDSQALLNLVAIKNPQKRQIAAAIIAAVDAFIVVVQNQHPDPSGNSVMLNSTSAQIKVAMQNAKTTALRK